MNTLTIAIPDRISERLTNEEIKDFLAMQLGWLSEHISPPPLASNVYAETTPSRGIDFTTHPFIGLWADREDMRDSVEYVRNLRRSAAGVVHLGGGLNLSTTQLPPLPQV
jgi:hypothetical protein